MSPNLIVALVSILLLACGAAHGNRDEHAEPDASGAGAMVDASDAPADAAGDAAAALPLPGVGELSGDCDVLDSELTAAETSLFESRLLLDGFDAADEAALTPGGQVLFTTDNAGGSSVLSEVFAFEVLARCELAALLATENEIAYEPDSDKTDFLAAIDGEKIGVSVTRAVAFPFDAPYPPAQAEDLLERKLTGILESTASVTDEYRWRKQILAILAYAPGHAEVLRAALATIAPETVSDTIVWIVVTDGDDDFIYCDGVCG